MNATNSSQVALSLDQLRGGVVVLASQPELNVGQIERVISALVGSTLTLLALRRAPLALLLALLGGGLLLRALSGRCSIYQALGISTATQDETIDAVIAVPAEPDHLPHSDDPVDYSSEDSFPASDPPAFNA